MAITPTNSYDVYEPDSTKVSIFILPKTSFFLGQIPLVPVSVYRKEFQSNCYSIGAFINVKLLLRPYSEYDYYGRCVQYVHNFRDIVRVVFTHKHTRALFFIAFHSACGLNKLIIFIRPVNYSQSWHNQYIGIELDL